MKKKKKGKIGNRSTFKTPGWVEEEEVVMKGFIQCDYNKRAGDFNTY